MAEVVCRAVNVLNWPNATARPRPTSLDAVAERDALGALQLLLARGGYGRDAKSRAMRAAARSGAAGSVQLLLAAGADVHSTEAGGQSALDLALRHGRIGVARALLAAGYDLSVASRAVNAVVAAAGATTCAVADAAAEGEGVAAGTQGPSGTVVAPAAPAAGAAGEQGAAAAGPAEGGEATAGAGAGSSAAPGSPLGAAAGSGALAEDSARSSTSWEALQLLVEAGVDLRGLLGGEALVALACAGGSVRTLVAAGVDVRRYGSRALVEAAAVARGLPGVTTAVKELLAAGVTLGPEGQRAAGQALEAAITNSNVRAAGAVGWQSRQPVCWSGAVMRCGVAGLPSVEQRLCRCRVPGALTWRACWRHCLLHRCQLCRSCCATATLTGAPSRPACCASPAAST